MIPLKLDLQGLYSYKEKQSIDFTQLTAAGLFGIFGAVGSGKSSILEAILLSLYGNTERLAARGEKTSMVNLQSDLLSISFEFKAGKNNGQSYKAIYISKRNKKNFDDVKPAEHNFYTKTPEGWLPIPERGEELVGMKMDHFRQTVIIPQGKFRDFIEQKPLARTEMMKDLFGLNRFDLSANTGSLMKKNNEKKIILETQLHSLSEATQGLLQEKEGIYDSQYKLQSDLGIKLSLLEKAFNHQLTIREKHLQLTELENQAMELKEQQIQIEKMKDELAQFQKAVVFIKPILGQLREKEIEVEKYEVSYKECARWKIDYQDSVTKLEKEDQKLKEDQSKKSEREGKIRDLQKIMEINLLEVKARGIQQEVDVLLPQSNTAKAEIFDLKKQIQDLEIREENFQVPDTQALADLKNALREWIDLEATQNKITADIQELNLQISNFNREIAELKSLLPEKTLNYDQWIHLQDQKLEELQLQREELLQQQGLAAYVHFLHEGENCPLCGSTSHPHPLSEKFNENNLKENESILKKLKDELETSRRHKESWVRLYQQLRAVEDYLGIKTKELSEKEYKRRELVAVLNKKGITSQAEIQQHLQLQEKAISEKQQVNKKLKQLRLDLQKKQMKFEEDENQLRNAEQLLLTLLTTLSAKKEEIRFPAFSHQYLGRQEGEIKQDIAKVQKRMEDLEINLKRNEHRLKEARKNQDTNLANLEGFEKLCAESKKKLKEIQDELTFQLNEQKFNNQDQVIHLLDNPLDPVAREKEIRAFENKKAITLDRIRELKKMEEVVSFNELAFEESKLQLQVEKEAFEHLKTQNTLLHKDISEIREKLKQKKSLTKDLNEIEKRELNLRELEKLFKGNGFVKFMSSIYLKELCHTANFRFMKLTKNSLSLEMDEDNNFWVKDYLNGGKKRLLKSLSGGQTFQASLCLALALAEKVKSLNRADQSFFFLDEGFGALDKSSLRTVFEALKTLRHENRVVGIISHVEELQQEIEVYAKVELDGERGSLVTYSF
jgi:exonuclease SbcC